MQCGVRMSFFNLFYQDICKTVVNIMSVKREKVFYAVGIGHEVGVYNTWNECKKQVTGIPNSKFRKFTTLKEAEQFVDMWRNKSKSVGGSSKSSNESSIAFNFSGNDKNQLEYSRQQQKGDKKLKKKGFEQVRGGNKFTENVDTRLTQNYNSQNVEFPNKQKWKTGQSSNNRDKYNKLYLRKKKTSEKVEVNKKAFYRRAAFHSASYQSFNERGKIVNQVYDTSFPVNQSQNNTSNTNVSFNLNHTTTSVSESRVSLLRKKTEQVRIPVLTHSSSYLTMGQTNNTNGFLQEPYVSPMNRYTNFIHRKDSNKAQVQLSDEMCLPSLMAVDSSYTPEFPKKCSDQKLIPENPLSVITPISIHESIKNLESTGIASICKTSGRSTIDKKVQSESETNKTNEKSQLAEGVSTSERKEMSQISCADRTVNDSKIVQQNMRETVKDKLTSIIVNHNENSVAVNNDTLERVLNAIWVVLKEVIVGNVVDDGTHQSKSYDLSKMNVAGSHECRESNSFSGEREEIVANDLPTCSTVKGTTESGDATEIARVLDKLANCEKKVDTGICKIGEFLSCLTDLKNEIVQLKAMIPQNCVEQSKEISGMNSCWKSTSGFYKSCACNCDMGEGGGNSNSQRHDSQRPRESKNSYSDIDDDVERQGIPGKRKRTREDHSSCNSQEKNSVKEIKQEHGDYVPFTTDENNYVVVYTDGSCMHNGTENAKAGIGIWFDDGHPLNVSRPLHGTEPTNNNAEIQAARIACELALNAGITKLKICTDSEFLINCITKWVHKWKTNGWLTEANKPVKNRFELEKLLEVISRLSVRWEKVAGHSAIKGNEMADRLANDGAAYYVKQ